MRISRPDRISCAPTTMGSYAGFVAVMILVLVVGGNLYKVIKGAVKMSSAQPAWKRDLYWPNGTQYCYPELQCCPCSELEACCECQGPSCSNIYKKNYHLRFHPQTGVKWLNEDRSNVTTSTLAPFAMCRTSKCSWANPGSITFLVFAAILVLCGSVFCCCRGTDRLDEISSTTSRYEQCRRYWLRRRGVQVPDSPAENQVQRAGTGLNWRRTAIRDPASSAEPPRLHLSFRDPLPPTYEDALKMQRSVDCAIPVPAETRPDRSPSTTSSLPDYDQSVLK